MNPGFPSGYNPNNHWGKQEGEDSSKPVVPGEDLSLYKEVIVLRAQLTGDTPHTRAWSTTCISAFLKQVPR